MSITPQDSPSRWRSTIAATLASPLIVRTSSEI